MITPWTKRSTIIIINIIIYKKITPLHKLYKNLNESITGDKNR